MAWETVAGHFGMTAFIHLLEKLRRVKFLRYRLIHPGTEIRVSVSALLRIRDGGKYVLVQNLHRPETFAPFGGVYKYHDHALSFLDALPFRPEDLGPGIDMKNDLRGYLPQGRLHAFSGWFSVADGRESASECLNRELEEEIRELGLQGKLPVPSGLQLRRVRIVEEGPETVPGLPCRQYRIFEVYEPIPSQSVHAFCHRLFKLSRSNKKLLVVDNSELVKGRAHDGRVTSHSADYLISNKRIHPDERPMGNDFSKIQPTKGQPYPGRS